MMIISDERRVSDLLHAVEVPPSGADIHRAIAVGQVRRHRRRYVATGSVATVAMLVAGTVLSLVAPGPASPPPAPADRPSPAASASARPVECQPVTLREPKNPPAGPVRISPNGRYILGDRYDVPSAASPPFVWLDGQPSDLPVQYVSVPVDINASGVAVGHADGKGWIYRDGVAVPLATPLGHISVGVNSVNARGDVAGIALRTAGIRVGVVWWAGQPTKPQLLDLPITPRRLLIADDGTAVASGGDATGAKVYRWSPDDGVSQVAAPPGLTRLEATHLNGVWVAGRGTEGGTELDVPVRWRLDTGEVERLPTGTGATAEPVQGAFGPEAVGVDGSVLIERPDGWTLVPGPGGGPPGDLPKLDPAPGRPTAAITPAGVLIGGVEDRPPSRPKPVLWRCG